MKVFENGKYRELSSEEMEQVNCLPQEPYERRVANRIRQTYSIDDEFAILRQRDTKPEEFEAYNSFVERIKAEERDL